jgi:hypothetical protein
MSCYGGISDNWTNINTTNSLNGLIKNNLIYAFDAARYLSYPTTGNTVNDLVSTVTGNTMGPTFSSDSLGCFIFDGSNDEIRLNKDANTYNPILVPQSNWSTYFWLNFNSVADKYFFGDWSGGPANMAMGIFNGKLKFTWYNGAWRDAISDGASVDVGKWNHIAYTTANGAQGTLKMYINGVLNYSYTPSTNWAAGNNMTTFGRYWGGSFFSGYMSMCQVYNVEHSISQVQQQFNAHRKRYNV